MMALFRLTVGGALVLASLASPTGGRAQELVDVEAPRHVLVVDAGGLATDRLTLASWLHFGATASWAEPHLARDPRTSFDLARHAHVPASILRADAEASYEVTLSGETLSIAGGVGVAVGDGDALRIDTAGRIGWRAIEVGVSAENLLTPTVYLTLAFRS